MFKNILGRNIEENDWLIQAVVPSNKGATSFSLQGSWVPKTTDLRFFAQSNHKIKSKEDVCGKAISPVTLISDNGKIIKANIDTVNALFFDIDKVTKKPVSLLLQALKKSKVAHILYSTFSNTDDIKSFRLIFPMSDQISSSKYLEIWSYVSRDLGDIVDQQCKHVSRQWLPPSAPYCRDVEHCIVNGNVLDLDKICFELQEEIEERLNNRKLKCK
tara:strand:- start:266 stop:913 length:648 start_codon:yes stop_codon:yes gene_type:complete